LFVQEYPIGQMACPLALIYGDIDDLTDMPWLLACVPPKTALHPIKDYEHLDTIWATTAPTLVRVWIYFLFLFFC
jgi:lysosomal acid lipase/cholesteryl ester hydrolase